MSEDHYYFAALIFPLLCVHMSQLLFVFAVPLPLSVLSAKSLGSNAPNGQQVCSLALQHTTHCSATMSVYVCVKVCVFVCMRQQLGQPASLATAAPATLQREKGERENAGGVEGEGSRGG